MQLIKIESSIEEQLKLEKELLQREGNFCLFNQPTNVTIVLGSTNRQEELVKPTDIKVIRRFSGGGTVILDENSLMVTFIFSSNQLYSSKEILNWGYEFYNEAFKLKGFLLRGNDFAIGDKKCAGNACFVKKKKWLLHSSFLWDYQKERMNILQVPKKQPEYRKGRDHDEFLIPLKAYFAKKQEFFDGIEKKLKDVLNMSLFQRSGKILNKKVELENELTSCK